MTDGEWLNFDFTCTNLILMIVFPFWYFFYNAMNKPFVRMRLCLRVIVFFEKKLYHNF